MELSERLRREAYRAKPVQRVYIPKSDGRQRPLGVPTLEDKLVQSATTEVLSAVYEQGFLGFSYGFRPGRSQHNALDAVMVALKKRKVNWVLDAPTNPSCWRMAREGPEVTTVTTQCLATLGRCGPSGYKLDDSGFARSGVAVSVTA